MCRESSIYGDVCPSVRDNDTSGQTAAAHSSTHTDTSQSRCPLFSSGHGGGFFFKGSCLRQDTRFSFSPPPCKTKCTYQRNRTPRGGKCSVPLRLHASYRCLLILPQPPSTWVASKMSQIPTVAALVPHGICCLPSPLDPLMRPCCAERRRLLPLPRLLLLSSGHAKIESPSLFPPLSANTAVDDSFEMGREAREEGGRGSRGEERSGEGGRVCVCWSIRARLGDVVQLKYIS